MEPELPVITPEMAEAGALEVEIMTDLGPVGCKQLAEAVFIVMWDAQKKRMGE